VQLPTHDERIAALEKDAASIKRDIAYKLDETNSAVTIINGVMGTLAQDVKIIKSQMKTMDIRLDGIDTRLARVEERQDEQGQGIREIKHRLDIIESRFETQDKKLDQVLQMLTTLTAKTDE
jgi:chromosome segregation ATPase